MEDLRSDLEPDIVTIDAARHVMFVDLSSLPSVIYSVTLAQLTPSGVAGRKRLKLQARTK